MAYVTFAQTKSILAAFTRDRSEKNSFVCIVAAGNDHPIHRPVSRNQSDLKQPGTFL